MMSRAAFLLAFCAAIPAVALNDPSRGEVDQEAIKQDALKRFCIYMQQRNPHIKGWKTGAIPTDKELETLFKRHPNLEKELNRIVAEFCHELEADKQKLERYRRRKTAGQS